METTLGTPTLHHSPGACSRVPLVLLEATGRPYGLVTVQLQQGEQHQPAFQQLNPKGKVPVLVHLNQPLTENVAIALWLSQQHPKARLLPAAEETWAHAQAVSWLAWCATTLHPLIFRVRMAQRVTDVADAQPGVRRLALEELGKQLQVAERHLQHHHWLDAVGRTAPDIYLYWCTGRALEAGLPTDTLPNLVAHRDRVHALPEVQRALARERTGV